MKKILVVDDYQDILDVVQIVLEGEGFRVQTCLNGACFQHMQDDLPDLILLDVLLDGEDGREICRRLKSQEQTKNIPVILISAHASANNALEACGANDFLAKPFQLKELVGRVRKYLSLP